MDHKFTPKDQDQRVFKRLKWKYIILDEAHNIKNWMRAVFKSMLLFAVSDWLRPLPNEHQFENQNESEMANFTSIQISKSSFINWYTSSGKFFERSLADQSEAFLLANQRSQKPN